METESSTTKEIKSLRRPDLRFLTGLVAVIICILLLTFSYMQNCKAQETYQKILNEKLTTIEERMETCETRLEKLEESGIVEELKNVTKALSSLKGDAVVKPLDTPSPNESVSDTPTPEATPSET